MRHQRIVNVSTERARVTYPWVYWDNAFTPDELERVIELCRAVKVEPGLTLGAKGKNRRSSKVRSSDIRWVYRSEGALGTAWFFDRINGVLDALNDRYYGFELNGFESMQYTEYPASKRGKYGWHMDMCLDRDHLPANMIQPRKLSMTMLLDDPASFKGGQFQINEGNEKEAKTVPFLRGRIVAFPSFMIHRVLPVTKGMRRSIVVWVEGPKFT